MLSGSKCLREVHVRSYTIIHLYIPTYIHRQTEASVTDLVNMDGVVRGNEMLARLAA